MIPIDVEVYIALEPINLRISFDLLAGLVRDRVGGDPKAGSMFVFFGKRKDKLKILFYDKTGFCILYKRLCRGTFRIPEGASATDTSIQVGEDELVVLLDGIGPPSGGQGGRKKKSYIH